MEIAPDSRDADAFITEVETLVKGVLREHVPASLILIKVNSWFGRRWFHFSGKISGQWGVWLNPLTVPPFVPSRIISQRRFCHPDYSEGNAGPPVHLKVRSTDALRRKLSSTEPGAALFWYSGGSKSTGRGSVMAYIPAENSYLSWYASWSEKGAWHIVETINTSQDQLLHLMELV